MYLICARKKAKKIYIFKRKYAFSVFTEIGIVLAFLKTEKNPIFRVFLTLSGPEKAVHQFAVFWTKKCKKHEISKGNGVSV